MKTKMDAWKLFDLHKSKQSNTTNMNNSFSIYCSGGTCMHVLFLLRCAADTGLHVQRGRLLSMANVYKENVVFYILYSLIC